MAQLNVNVNNRAFNSSNQNNSRLSEEEQLRINQQRINNAAANQRSQIESEYNTYLRKNRQEAVINATRYSNQEIDSNTFNANRTFNNQDRRELEQEKKDKLEELARRQVQLLESLNNQGKDNSRTSATDAQRDNSEHNGRKGYLSDLFDKRSKLLSRRNDAKEEDVEKYNKLISRYDDKISKAMGRNPMLSRFTDNLNAGGNIISTAANGNPVGAISSLGSLMSNPYILAIGASLGAIWGGMALNDKRKGAENSLMGYYGNDRTKVLESFTDTSYAKDYGIDGAEFGQLRKSLISGSGKLARGDSNYALDVLALQRATGIDNIAGISGNERQDKYGKSTADNIVSMLNVLGEIRDGSISPTDLALANEKAMLMFRLQGNQKMSNDTFDQRQVLGTMAAGEIMGGAFKDDRAADTWSQAFNSIKDGGNDNIRALKYQFALKANPSLGRPGNEYALSEYVESGTDPAYLASVVEGLQKMSGGNENMLGFSFKEFFKGMSPNARRKLMSMSPEAAKYLKDGVNEKTNGVVGDMDSFRTAAQEQTLMTDVVINGFSEGAQDILRGIANTLTGNKAKSNTVAGKK